MSAPERPTKTQLRDEARAAALALRDEQQRKAKRQRTLAIGVAVGAVILFGVLIWLIMADANRSALEDVALSPAGATLNGGIPVGPDGVAGVTDGAATDAVVVAVYSDYICPYCGFFEMTNGSALDEMREAGEIIVEYHPLALFDDQSMGTRYSTRAATAAAMVADLAPEHFVAFNNGLFANEPDEGTEGLTSAQIADIAREAGVPEAVAATIESGEYLGQQADAEGLPLDQTYVPWVVAATEQASKDLGRLATPTILLDGVELDTDTYNWQQPGVLAQAVQDARG